MKNPFFSLFQTSCLAFSYLVVSFPVCAQDVTPDGTTATDVKSPDGQNFDIGGGDRAGGNLFHSFGNFGVPTGGSANFLNSADISNIISRVTGGSITSIDGLIRANGSANLFLINPAGVIFGPNASLSIGGSFLGSTADSVLFNDGREFSALNAQGKPLLTINAPIGLNIRDNPAPITNNSVANQVGLQVNSGQNITLVGGNIDFDGGKITAPGGTVSLGSLGAAGTVGLNENGSLTLPDGVQRGDITLKNGATVNVRAGGGGFINVSAKNLTLSEGSELFAGIEENQGSPDAVGGDIIIDATDTVKLIGSQTQYTQPNDPNATEESQDLTKEGLEIEKSQGTGIRNNVGLASSRRGTGSESSNAKGKGGNITIKTGKLELVDVAGIDGNLYGQGTGSNISISATDISFNGLRSYIASSVQGADFGKIKEKASGTAGDINIDTNNLTLNGFAGISTRVSDDGATGKAGNINIKASDRVTLNDGSFILSQVGKGAIGTGGNIAIDTKNISFTNTGGLDKSGIYADTQGEGSAGSIFIKASDSVLLDSKALLLTQVGQTGIGDAGNIQVETGNFSLKGESKILSDTNGQGNAGNISVKASDLVSFEAQSNATSQVGEKAIGNGGNIEISAKNINFNTQGIALNSSTNAKEKGQDGNPSQAGNIVVKASENINLDNSNFFSQVNTDSIGNAGNIEIETGNLSLTNRSLLLSNTTGKGNAGNINVKANSNIVLSGGSFFISSVDPVLDYSKNPNSPQPQFDEQGNLKVGEGNAGDINIETGNLTLTNSKILTDTKGKGNAGNITIKASDTISLISQNDNSLILSSVEVARDNGKPSKPILNSQGVAFTGEGDAGNISITTGNLSLTGKRTSDNSKFDRRSFIIADTKGKGKAGDINIQATGKISLDNDSIILAAVDRPNREPGFPGGEGNAGNINITSGDMNLNNQSLIIAGTSNKGDAGSININSTGNISLDVGSKIVTATGSEGITGQVEGNAGKIDITANSISLNDFSVISANTNRRSVKGSAGDINITTAKDLRLTNGSFISAITENDFNAGNITINSQNLELMSGGKIVTGTDGKGSAGNINLNIAKDIKIDGKNTPKEPSANVYFTDYYSESDDPESEPIYRERILRDLGNEGFTGLFAGGTKNSTGSTGEIKIGASNIQLQNNANITAEATGGATGGNISIKANSVVADNTDNNIKASADRGKGGEIKIDTPTAWGWTVGKDNPQTSDIDATSNVEGGDGIVNITASDFQSNQEIVESPQNVVEVEQIDAQACSGTQDIAQQNTFTILGRGSVENGTKPLNSSLVRVSQRTVQDSNTTQSFNPQPSNSQQKPLSSDDIIPARGVAMNEKGQIVLTRYPTPNTTNRPSVRSPWCQARE
jgi:filamentous hemagglutinin family protein